MSFLDLYQGDQEQAASIQPNEGTSLPSGFDANLHAAWSDGQMFSQSIARENARAGVLSDYVDEIRQKTGNDLNKDFDPTASGPGQGVSADFDAANARVAKLRESYPDLDLAPLDNDEIDRRALAKAQAAHRTYETLQQAEKTWGGSFGSFLGGAASSATDPVNLVALGIAPETGGIGILSAALRWGALAGTSQAAIEAASGAFKEQVQPGYLESGAPLQEVGGAFLGGALLGGSFKAIGNAWTRVKTGAWPTSVRDAGNVIESEANVAQTNIFPGVEGEVAHREALVKTIDDILAGRPVDVGGQITPELQQAAADAERAKIVPEPPSGLPPEQLQLPLPTPLQNQKLVVARRMPDGEIKIGKPGQIHSDLMTKAELATDSDTPEIAASMGYANTEGKFLTRQEALDFAKKNEPQRAAWSAQQPEFGLDAATYNEAVQPKAAIDEDLVGPDAYQAPNTFNENYGAEVNFKKGDILQKAEDAASVQSPGEYLKSLGIRPQQTPEEMSKTLTSPDHQDAIRADIDRARAMGDIKVPGVDENGNHTMVGVDAAMDEVDAYKQAAEQIQACANPPKEEAA